ncbi:hypothetical protein W02_39900 [Nitrospira sp. KM1]|nr:hypothetical protein W02_39900 [Nitrospira sp. KM1]
MQANASDRYDPAMPHARFLVTVLALLILIGAVTMQSPRMVEASTTGQLWWSVYLVVMPVMLAGLVLIGWAWTAMACVGYGTINLALDLATVTSMVAAGEISNGLYLEHALSGLLDVGLIVMGGVSFVQALQRSSLRGFHPPNLRSPSSSGATGSR